MTNYNAEDQQVYCCVYLSVVEMYYLLVSPTDCQFIRTDITLKMIRPDNNRKVWASH